MTRLTEMHCSRPQKGEGLSDDKIAQYREQVPEWDLQDVDGIPRIARQYKFKNFSQALAFAVQIGILAEKEDHHPKLTTEWGKVEVAFWTHFIQGLHLNDFIAAAKSDRIFDAS